jgi:Protein of unknown function (DUF664)
MDALTPVLASLEEARRTFTEQVRDLQIDEALDAAGGFRSMLGIAKHTAAWSEVYRSFAFDREPRHWDSIDWPRGLRDRIDPTTAYLEEIIAWFDRTHDRWRDSLAEERSLEQDVRLHWGGTAPLIDVVAMVTTHWAYHAGEINAILAIRRQEAWEQGEEVEENHISTEGHRVRPPWWPENEVLPPE